MEDKYLKAMYEQYEIPNSSDLCCYWFERGRQRLETALRWEGTTMQDRRFGEGPFGNPSIPRVGLLATQGIRGGANRTTLDRIKQTGDIFAAWPDKEWVLDGAHVHVSIIGFDDGTESEPQLDGSPAAQIHVDLTGDVNTASAQVLSNNEEVSFQGPVKVGKFDIDWRFARDLLASPNPASSSNFDVLFRWFNGSHLTGRAPGMWIIDFDELSEKQSAAYEKPFEYVRSEIKPSRDTNNVQRRREYWWRLGATSAAWREASESLHRVFITPRVSKHRVFVPVPTPVVPDSATVAFARDDDYFFGVLHSTIHELWARRMGTQLREAESGFRYTPTSCFETFPLPWPLGQEYTEHPAYQRIAEAARELNEQRENWLNPPAWLDPIARQVDAEDAFDDVAQVSGEQARALIRRSEIQARAAQDANLKERTLTNLYNERPTWLQLAHEKLDRAVLAAYAATDLAGDWHEDWATVWKETGAGQPLPEGHEQADRRDQVGQPMLANLLRLNQSRAEHCFR
jgi:hypothetical protein